jgi:PiT family inorganic phosphate transporter
LNCRWLVVWAWETHATATGVIVVTSTTLNCAYNQLENLKFMSSLTLSSKLMLGGIFLGIFGLMGQFGLNLVDSMQFTLVMKIAVLCIILSFAFDFVNGFHDTAHAVATIIYSGAMPPWMAIGMSAVLNFAGAVLVGTSVAHFVASTVPMGIVTPPMILATLLAGLFWNIITWLKGLPVSSTHCLLGSLAGAGFATAGLEGFSHPAIYKALVALVVSPLIGFVLALALAWCFKLLLNKTSAGGKRGGKESKSVQRTFKTLQILSSGLVSFTHGSNDGQKTMGLITLILATQFASYGYSIDTVPLWVKLGAAAAIGLGTAIGGWPVIRTVGEKLSHKGIDPVHGCSTEFMTALTVFLASKAGVPVSTTHVLTSGVVGATYGLHGAGHANWHTLKKVGLAWVITLPLTFGIAFALAKLLPLALA